MINPDGTWRAWLGDLGNHDGGTLTLKDGIVTGAEEMAGKGTYRIEGDDVIVDIAPDGVENIIDRYVIGPVDGDVPEAPEAMAGFWTPVDPDDDAIEIRITLLREP